MAIVIRNVVGHLSDEVAAAGAAAGLSCDDWHAHRHCHQLHFDVDASDAAAAVPCHSSLGTMPWSCCCSVVPPPSEC